jgi:hypothetical protein
VPRARQRVRDHVRLGDLVQHGDGQVGEGPAGGQYRVAVGAGADAGAVGQPAPEVGCEQVVERGDVAVGEDLLEVAGHQRLVLGLGHAASTTTPLPS